MTHDGCPYCRRERICFPFCPRAFYEEQRQGVVVLDRDTLDRVNRRAYEVVDRIFEAIRPHRDEQARVISQLMDVFEEQVRPVRVAAQPHRDEQARVLQRINATRFWRRS